MALIIYGVLKEDQYSQADIYYPSWDKIDSNCIDILSNNIEPIIHEPEDNISVCSDKSI